MLDDNYDKLVTIEELQTNLDEFIDSKNIIGILDITGKKVTHVMIPYHIYEIMLKDLNIFTDD